MTRQEKKRLSLGIFGKTNPMESTTVLKEEKEKERKSRKQTTEELLETASTTASSRSRSKEAPKNRLSINLLPMSPPPEALPHFPKEMPSQASLTQTNSRGQSVDGRPTSKSGKSTPHTSMGSSVKKRLSFMSMGKKKSKNGFKARGVDDTLEEE